LLIFGLSNGNQPPIAVVQGKIGIGGCHKNSPISLAKDSTLVVTWLTLWLSCASVASVRLQPVVYARQGREFMGCKSPVGGSLS